MSRNVATVETRVENVAVLDAKPQRPNASGKNPAHINRPANGSNTSSLKVSADEKKLTLVITRDIEALKEHEAAWQDMADKALEPNICYEPCALLPAIKTFGASADLHFILIYATDPHRPQGAKILCGLFPLERVRRYKRLPIAAFQLWKHEHNYLCTPLLRSEYAVETLAAFFDWLESRESPAPLMAFRHIAGDGLFSKLLLEELNRRGNLPFHDEWYNRALYRPHSTAATFVEGISGRHKKELRRKQNRLAEEGLVEFVVLEAEDDIEAWVEDFLRLEASGWKGQEGTAFAVSKASRTFFEEITRKAYARGQLMMLALRLDNQPIAMKCNFLSGRGSFAFKIAFDESFARYSPGVLLELENMRRLSMMPDVEWMDSCAASEHFMINRLWTDRRLIETILVSTGKGLADFTISALPLLRWLSRKWKGVNRRNSHE